MIGKAITTNVLLPAWMFEQAKDKDHFKGLLKEYMLSTLTTLLERLKMVL